MGLAEALDDLEAEASAAVAAIRVAALTGLRTGEVLAIRWAHVDFRAAHAAGDENRPTLTRPAGRRA